MRKYCRLNFAQKLILSLLSVLLLIFGIILISLLVSSRNYIKFNACNQAYSIAHNIIQTLDRKIFEIEQIPHIITSFVKPENNQDIHNLPQQILNSYPYLQKCFILSDTNRYTPKPIYSYATQTRPDTVLYPAFLKNKQLIFRHNNHNGHWSFSSQKTDNTIICYCEPIYNHNHRKLGLLGIEFPIERMTDFIHDIRLFESGYIFLTDEYGNFILHPHKNISKFKNILSYINQPTINYSNILDRFFWGQEGNGIVFRNNIKYFIYFVTVKNLNWRMGIICPYDEISTTYHKFYSLLLVILCSSMLFLIWAVFKIVYKISRPLKIFAVNVKKISNGEIDLNLPSITSDDEIGELHEAFRQMQENINAYIRRLHISTEENEKINTEIRLARKLQERFLPKSIQLSPNIELCRELRQSKSVGGDLYEYFLIENHLYFVIGDVSGKGIPAALYMASVIKLFRYVASRQISTARICDIINSYMCDNTDDDMYITMFVGIMDIHTGKITFTNAGHPAPFIIHENKQISYLNKYPDAPIGIVDDYRFSEHTYTLSRGCQILLYTDGITDAENAHSQFFGKSRLVQCLRHTPSNHPNEIIQAVIDEIQTHIHDREQSDDFTILSILYKGEPDDPAN